MVWATSMPELNAANAQTRWAVATPRLSMLDAKPRPWITPTIAAITGRDSDGTRLIASSAATTIYSAIAGSTTLAGTEITLKYDKARLTP